MTAHAQAVHQCACGSGAGGSPRRQAAPCKPLSRICRRAPTVGRSRGNGTRHCRFELGGANLVKKPEQSCGDVPRSVHRVPYREGKPHLAPSPPPISCAACLPAYLDHGGWPNSARAGAPQDAKNESDLTTAADLTAVGRPRSPTAAPIRATFRVAGGPNAPNSSSEINSHKSSDFLRVTASDHWESRWKLGSYSLPFSLGLSLGAGAPISARPGRHRMQIVVGY